MINTVIGIFIGLIIGFPIGFLCFKKAHREDWYGRGFNDGYEVAKGNFYNPNAKG